MVLRKVVLRRAVTVLPLRALAATAVLRKAVRKAATAVLRKVRTVVHKPAAPKVTAVLRKVRTAVPRKVKATALSSPHRAATAAACPAAAHPWCRWAAGAARSAKPAIR